MADFVWTSEQRAAIETVDRSVLVSAAAGSGKTAVLTARCVHLVCDAPPDDHCDVDRLLVVTFTEAAAAEMKERIRKGLSQRSMALPQDRRLRAQMALIDTAQISTLHAFCLWMVRRWFHRAGVDATAQLLDEHEARLLRRDVLDALFNDRYAGDDAVAQAFRRLVEDYGLGDDREIASFVLRLANFVVSLPEPEKWLARARDDSDVRLDEIVDAQKATLLAEMFRQADYCTKLADHIGRHLPVGLFYGEQIRNYARHLLDWHNRLEHGEHGEAVRQEIAEYELSAKGSPRLGKDTSDEDRDQRDQARDLFTDVQQKLFKKRLRARLCRFSAAEQREGIVRVMPYIATLADLTTEFQRRFDQAKRTMGMMDFADLERLAYRLLTETREGEQSNPIVAELRQRFRHVLVDEFQDINPLQARLLSLVSRERVSGSAGNLFTVGDVKQSIYRFRLAEPALFLDRERDFRSEASQGVCIDLQTNYRSRPTILHGVNAIFKRLMQKDCGGIAYDSHAELKPPNPQSPPGDPIELHILERNVSADRDEEDDGDVRFVDVTNPAQWRGIEREAFLIGTRIRAMMDKGMSVEGEHSQRPLQYKDVCVLLRSTKHSAGSLANMLNQMGIPAWTDVGDGLFSALEVRDVLSLLTVMDNVQQDIPLAAVLRSGILRERVSEDELAEIRVFDQEGAFQEAVREYAKKGPNERLRDKLAHLLRRIRKYRDQVRVRPLADVLWNVYRETGYLAYVGGLRHGDQRRTNLITLHERARQFGQFRRQGLRRFLRFIEMLQEANQDLGSPPALGEADNVVRIMSIHKSKGLEFPVVFAAELGRQFNLGDSRGRFLFDRQVGIGLKAIDRERLIEYPTALHQRCARTTEEASLAEELRVWYVAITRAKEKLILVGSDELDTIDRLRSAATSGNERVSPLSVLSARSPLHWMVAALSQMPNGDVTWDEAARANAVTRFEVTTHEASEIQSWRLPGEHVEDSRPLHRAVAAMAPLPDSEPVSQDSTVAEQIVGRLDYAYPHLGVSSIQAVQSASEAKQPYAELAIAEEGVMSPPKQAPPQVTTSRDASEAIRRGQVTHRALQFLCLDRTSDIAEIATEVGRLASEKVIAEDDAPLIDVEALAWFFATDLGRRIRKAQSRYHREWMFLSTEQVEMFDPTVLGTEDDRVLVRGVVDGVLATQTSLEVIDFKTDRVATGGVESRAAEYAMQMRLYASAVAEVFNRPVDACHLVFLHSRRIV